LVTVLSRTRREVPAILAAARLAGTVLTAAVAGPFNITQGTRKALP
jgi:hypothetical protein